MIKYLLKPQMSLENTPQLFAGKLPRALGEAGLGRGPPLLHERPNVARGSIQVCRMQRRHPRVQIGKWRPQLIVSHAIHWKGLRER
jgi:hypothetical protein